MNINELDENSKIKQNKCEVTISGVNFSASNNQIDFSNSCTSIDALVVDDSTENVRETSCLESLMTFLKGNIGTGILALPAAFKSGGLWLSFVSIFILGGIALHCMHILMKCANIVCERTGRSVIDYGKVAEEVIKFGPRKLRKFTRSSKNIVNTLLCLMQFGVCIVYILFIAKNIKMVVEEYSEVKLNIRLYELFVALFLAPYLCIGKLKVLSIFSAIANVVMILGLGVVLYVCFIDIPPLDSRPAFTTGSSFVIFFGVAVYSIEGIGVVLPIENKIKNSNDMTKLFGVMNIGMLIAIIFYAIVGFFGYLKFGDEIKGSITLNFPNTVFYNITRLAFALAIFFTYGIQFYVPIQILWPVFNRYIRNDKFFLKNHGEKLLRMFFLIITLILALIIPNLELMISLIGAVTMSFIAMIVPAVLEILILWPNQYGKFHWIFVKNVLLFILGILAFIIGTVVTILDIIQKFNEDSK